MLASRVTTARSLIGCSGVVALLTALSAPAFVYAGVSNPAFNACPGTVATITELSTDNVVGVTWSSLLTAPLAGGFIGVYFANNGPGPITFASPAWSTQNLTVPTHQPTAIPLMPAGSTATLNDLGWGGTFSENVDVLGCIDMSGVSLSAETHGTAQLDLAFYRGTTLHVLPVTICLSSDASACQPEPSDCIPAPSGLVGWWPADGDASDLAGSANGILINGTSFDLGRVAEGFVFDAVDDYVAVPSSSDLELTTALTADAWIYLRDSQPAGCATPDGSLRAWWRTEGNADDALSGMNNGTLVNEAAFAAGLVGQALSLDGSNDYLTVPSSPDLTPHSAITLDAWVFLTAVPTGSGASIIMKGPDGEVPGDWTLAITPGLKLRPHVMRGGTWHFFDCTTTLALHTWYHVAMTYDGTSLRGFVNGVLDGIQAGTGPIQVSAFPLRIGAYAPVNGSVSQAFFPGLIDEPAVHVAALSSASVSAIFIAGSAGRCPSTGYTIVAKGIDAESAIDWSLGITNERRLRPHINAGGVWHFFDCATPLAFNVWHHVGMTYDGSVLTGYVDAVMDGSISVSGGIQATSYPMRIGAYAPLNGRASRALFPGLIDEVEIFNRALTADEITRIVAAGGAGKCKTEPVSDLMGTASLVCNGQSQPAGNVTVNLLDEALPFLTTTTNGDGEYHFDDVPQGTYTVAIEAPPGYAVAPDTRVVTIDQAELTLDPFVFTCLLSDLTGQVTGTCDGQTNGLYGITVDVFRDDGQGMDVLIATTASDAAGNFRFDDLALGDYTVGIVLPLGYTTANSSQAVTLDTPDGSLAAETFALACQETAAEPRSMGYWKHQVNVYLTGKGSAQESLADLLHYIDELVIHFNQNLVNPVIVYVPGGTATQDKLLQLQQLLTVNKGGTLLDRAKQQLLALLLNVVSGKIGQTQVISGNGATVSQAVTHSHDLIVDGNPATDETAKTICDLINNGQIVPAGMVPVNTRIITYDQQQAGTDVAFGLYRVYPNPIARGATVSLGLPIADRAELTLLDIAGRVVWRREVLGAGQHAVRLDPSSRLAPGVYLLRMRQGASLASKPVVVVR